MSMLITNKINSGGSATLGLTGSLSVSSGVTFARLVVQQDTNLNGGFRTTGTGTTINFNGTVNVAGLCAGALALGVNFASCTEQPTLATHLVRKDYIDNISIGVAQSQQAGLVRVAGETYTNPSATKPIFVTIGGTTVAAVSIEVGGVIIFKYPATNAPFPVCFIVPPLQSYKYSGSAPASWSELS